MRPIDVLRHHVTGAIERGEAQTITEIPAPSTVWERLKRGERATMSGAEYDALVDWLNRDGAPEDADIGRLASVPDGEGATVENGPYRAFLLTDEMAKTREECAEAVEGPGKFEGEQPYAAHFYDAMMNGDGEDVYPPATGEREEDESSDMLYTRFTVEPEDVELFPELAGRASVCFRETDSGFWCEVDGE